MESYATAAQVYAAGLIFARLGALVMLIPGIGDSSVPPRIRLSCAFLLTLMLTPVIAPAMAVPESSSALGGAVIKEVLIGLMIGGILRMFLSSLAAAGEIISLQTTLSFSQTAAPGSAQPSTSISTFLGLIGLTARITEREQAGRTMYRVRLGPFPTRDEADTLQTLQQLMVQN